MSSFSRDHDRDSSETFGERWNQFWFTPSSPLPCSVLRICVGLLVVAHFLDLGTGLNTWFARDGILPPAAVSTLLTLAEGSETHYRYSYLGHFPSSTELWIVHGLAIVVALAFALGLLTRISGILTLVAVLAYVHRVPQVAGHAEPVLSFLLGYLCIAPAGACLSLDNLLWKSKTQIPPPNESRHAEREFACQPSVAANISLRLIQVHLAMFYAMMGLTKLYGDAWWEGSGVWVLLAQTQSRPLDLTGLRQLGQSGEYLLNFWAHAIVYFELAFPILIWNRFTRPLLLVAAIFIWLSLIVASGLVLFGLTMIVANLAFVPAASFPSFGLRTSPANQVNLA